MEEKEPNLPTVEETPETPAEAERPDATPAAAPAAGSASTEPEAPAAPVEKPEVSDAPAASADVPEPADEEPEQDEDPDADEEPEQDEDPDADRLPVVAVAPVKHTHRKHKKKKKHAVSAQPRKVVLWELVPADPQKAETEPPVYGGGAIAWALLGVILIAVLCIGLYLSGLSNPILEAMGRQDSVFYRPTPTPVLAAVPLDNSLATPTPVPEPTPTPTPTPSPTPSPAPTLHPLHGDIIDVGTITGIVLDIQIQLMVLEYLDFDVPSDEFSDGTAEALLRFQRRNGLATTGECDASTFEKLFDPAALTYAVVENDEGDEVLMIEERLIDLGYLEGEADTVFDAATADAAEVFRRKNNLDANRTIDMVALNVLLGDETVAFYFGLGDESEEIKTYQQILYKLGYLTFAPDGKFGKQTSYAVKRFQEENGLDVDSCLTKSTIEALQSGTAAAFQFKNGMEGEDVKRIQDRLADFGYLTGSQITGYFGDKTESAVKTFQKRNSLKQTGIVDASTIAKLNNNKSRAAVTVSQTTSGDKSGGTTGSTINYGKGIDAFIQIAQSKLGSPYVRGAKGPNSFDCSGFVYWCLNQAGVKQGYLNSVGWKSCSKYQRVTSMSDLKRGDVLVFRGDNGPKGHVGIYLGNGKMIDAGSSKGKVVIRDSIHTNYWTSHFICAYHIW